jgi:hypothetical protein
VIPDTTEFAEEPDADELAKEGSCGCVVGNGLKYTNLYNTGGKFG